ncbi:hypothetical protein MMC08_005400 [Hypocenomyce scalaris]|nr:hypothetical protein [Hypocenomyce scalaris]
MSPPSKQQAQASTSTEPDSHFTVFIRLPFPRGDFVDPPPIDWDAAKDRALWQVLSRASKGSEIDWSTLADEFDVSLQFLLQQAAWLYERQLSQVRAQLRKVSRPTSAAPSPTPGSVSGSTTVGSHAMKRVDSGSGGSRAPSSLSVRARDSANFRSEGSTSSTPVQARPPSVSRSPLTNAVYEAHKQLLPTTQQSIVGESSQPRPPPASRKATQTSVNPRQKPPSPPTSPPAIPNDSPSSSSSSASDAAPLLTKSRAFTRRPRFSSQKATLGPLSSADEDSEDSPAFLPFSEPIYDPLIDPTATLRLPPTAPSTQPPDVGAPPVKPPNMHSSSSSTNSASLSRPTTTHPARPPHGALSPRRAADLGLSPRQRDATTRKGSEGTPSMGKGSDGTPSMGSSFSDLDDASVTQSALEEALARDMQHGGGVASRMSTISQALRSRYL